MTPEPAHRTAGQILDGVAGALALGDPIVWRRLLNDHVADDTGRCAVCHINGVGRPFWPCTLRAVAEQAQRLTTSARVRPGRRPAGT